MTDQRAVGRQDSYLSERRTLLPAARVRELSKARPGRVLRDTALCWAIILAAWVAAAWIDAWWAVALAIVLVGNRYYGLFIIGHDGMHRRLFESSDRNDLYCDLLLLGPIGAITRVNNRNHLAHHQFLSTDADPDRYKHACFNKASPVELAGYLTGASIAKNVGNVFHVKPAEAEAKPPRPKYRVRDLAIIATWQLLLLAALTWAFGWWGYILMWWVPVFVFMFLADNLRTFCEHSHTESDEEADRHRLVTNKPGWLERQLLSPMNMNYHAAHHLWPSIPYYNLPQADAEMALSPAAATVTWRGSYLAYLKRYARALPIEGCGATAAGA